MKNTFLYKEFIVYSESENEYIVKTKSIPNTYFSINKYSVNKILDNKNITIVSCLHKRILDIMLREHKKAS